MKLLSSLPLAAMAISIFLTGCAGTRPLAYSGIKSSSLLAPNSRDNSGRVPYAYLGQTDWQKYKCVLVDPVVVYDGSDNQFKKTSGQEKQMLADYMLADFRRQLKSRYELVDFSAPDTLRVRLTLCGAEPSVPVLGTLTRVDLSGGAYNLIQSLRRKEGAFTGWASFAVEVSDAGDDHLLTAYVEKQYPCAMNVMATFGKWDATKKGIDKGAKELVERLR